MDLTLRRLDLSETRTIGGLYVDGLWECWTLEDRVREPGVKVPGQTAIPVGRYQVVVTFSQRFQAPLPILLAVPMFEGIRIHAGNTAADTEGCILVGQQRLQNAITLSRRAVADLITKIQRAEGEVWITVGGG